MTDSLRDKMSKKKKDIENARSSRYLSLFGTVAVLAVTFIIGFAVGYILGKFY